MTNTYATTDRDCLLRLRKMQAELEYYSDGYDREGSRFPAWPLLEDVALAVKDAIEKARKERPRLRDL